MYILACIHTYIYTYINAHTYIHIYNTHIHTYTHIHTHKRTDDMNEGTENALNVIVSTTRSSGNMKKKLKTTISDTVPLEIYFVKLVDNNESNTSKITELEQQVAKTNAVRGEGTGRTYDYIADPSSAPVRNTNGQEGNAANRREGKTVLGDSGGENYIKNIQINCNVQRQLKKS